jgi:hypothetical protein
MTETKTKRLDMATFKELHAELDAGLKAPRSFTVRQAVDDWLRDGLDGESEPEGCTRACLGR